MYRDKYLGVKWTIRFDIPLPSERNCMIEVKINPQFLLGNNDYLTICNETHLPAIIKAYDTFAKSISRNLPPFVAHTLNRVDYCGNFDLREMGYSCTVKQKLKLMKQVFIPYHYKVPEKYDYKLRRKVPYRNGLYAKTGSSKINNYGKQRQLEEKFPHEKETIEKAENLLRYEVHCGKSKMSRMRKLIADSSPLGCGSYRMMERLLSTEVAKAILASYFQRTIMQGDYYTIEQAIEKIETHNFREPRHSRLIDTLELVHEHGGIDAAKKHLESVALGSSYFFVQSAKELAELGINPVTSPRRVGYVQNLLSRYDEMERYGDLSLGV